MLVTVVTVVRNEKSVLQTVESILAQEHVSVECVVVDGASTDGTLEALKGYGNRIRLLSEPDKGIYDAMNKGLKLGNGDILGFLNAGDVFVGKDNLAAVAAAFEQDPELGACMTDLEIVDAQDKVLRWWPAVAHRPGAFSEGWTPAHPTFYARRGVLLALGGFNTSYTLAADFDLMMRALEISKVKSLVLNRTLVRMRAGGASQGLRGLFVHNREAWVAATAAGLTRWPFWPFMARRLARKLPQLFRRPS